MTTQAAQPNSSPFTALALGFAIGLAGLTYLAFVVTQLWAWFVVPAFGLPALSMATACGLALVGRALAGTSTLSRIDVPPAVRPFATFIANTVLLTFGYVVHLFM